MPNERPHVGTVDPSPPPLEPGLAERVMTPALVIDLGAARRNVDAVLRLTAGPARWRPHVKTAKVPEVLALYAAAGIRRYKCATTREADVLARVLREASVPAGDVLVAHHLHGAALARLDDLAGEWTDARFSTLVESVEQVEGVPRSAGLFVDVDLGMGRTGIGLGRRDEIAAIARAAGPRFRGLHAYDGHRHEADVLERARLVHATYDELVGLVEALAEEGLRPKEVITAGTPAFPSALEHVGLATLDGTVHRVSPGTVVYHDLRSAEQLPDLDKEYAATVLTCVASLPGEETFTCDAGSKAVEGTGPDRIAAVLGRPEFEAAGQSEEHTVLRAPEGQRPERGTPLRLVPGHVCPTVNLAESVVLVDDGRYVGTVDVAARAHETLVRAGDSRPGDA
ncbi:MAG: alanine racemase [Planctomycetota bacterium]